MDEIWARCHKTEETRLVEREAIEFLKRYQLEDEFPLERIERMIYEVQPGQEDQVFAPLVARLRGDLAVLYKFDQVFRQRLFPHIPQKLLNGLSPVRFTLNLKLLRDSSG